MVGYQPIRSTCKDSLKAVEADIQHANMLAASIPRSKNGERLQMKLVHNQWAPLILYLLQWLDCSCLCLQPTYLNLFHVAIFKVNEDGKLVALSQSRRASIKDFYAVILPYLQRLHGDTLDLHNDPYEGTSSDFVVKKRIEEKRKLFDNDPEREDECGICLEPCTKMVLPNCCHAMCTNCYRDWNVRSESCPFCRGNIKRVKSEDLWVLTCDGDLVDKKTASNDDLLRFYLYINSLPADNPDALFLVYCAGGEPSAQRLSCSFVTSRSRVRATVETASWQNAKVRLRTLSGASPPYPRLAGSAWRTGAGLFITSI